MTPPIVYCDLTPDNLILKSQGALKLVDFDVAEEVMLQQLAPLLANLLYVAQLFKRENGTQKTLHLLAARCFIC